MFYAGKVIKIIINEFGFQKRGEPDTILRIMSKIYTNTPTSEYGSTPQKSPIVDLTGNLLCGIQFEIFVIIL